MTFHKNYFMCKNVYNYLNFWLSLHWKFYDRTLGYICNKQNSAGYPIYIYLLWPLIQAKCTEKYSTLTSNCKITVRNLHICIQVCVAVIQCLFLQDLDCIQLMPL